MKRILVTIIVSLSLYSFGQTPESISETFLKNLKEKGIEYALENAPKDSFLISNLERQEKVKTQYAEFKSKLGKYYGYEEIIKEKSDIKCLIVKSYILKFEDKPATLMLIYYKPNDKWYLHNVFVKRFTNKK